MDNETLKARLCELRKLLNSAVTSDSLHSDHILELSTELDSLIRDFYLLVEKNSEENSR